jgi:hypothetical protein
VLFAADDPDCREPEVVAGRSGGADVVGVGPAEGQQRVMAKVGGRRKVELELPPLVAGEFRMDQIVTLEVQVDPSARQKVVDELLDRRWYPQVKRWSRRSAFTHE